MTPGSPHRLIQANHVRHDNDATGAGDCHRAVDRVADKGKTDDDTAVRRLSSSLESPGVSATGDPGRLRLLVIDDDDFMLDLVSATLERLGAAGITTCHNGREALAALDDGGSFDVLMVDLNMPGMDGIELLRNLAARRFPGGILLFSGEDARILRTARNLAASHNLTVLGALEKPVSIEVLRDRLSTYRPAPRTSPVSETDAVTPEAISAAIEQQAFVPFFQPKVAVRGGRVVSLEVLARWPHPTFGFVPPVKFIPVAEEHGLIERLTDSLFGQAFRRLGAWRDQGRELTAGLNLSVESLYDVELPEKMAAMAQACGLPCSAVEFEVTESRLMAHLTTALDVLTRLRLKGFGLSIDDFGTGYSSMAQLANVPFTELKIDRAFVHGATHDTAARAILESSIELGKKLDMVVVAEGVEDRADWDLVAQAGCDLAQGYFIARPMSGPEFDAWMISTDGRFAPEHA